MASKRLVILDRDGVINHDSPTYVKSVKEWQPIRGSLDAIAKLNQAGFRVVVATNQSGVGRKLFTLEALSQIHEQMTRSLSAHGASVDAIFFCICTPEQNCNCRKPKPGMLLEIASRTGSDLSKAIMIGDSLRDVEAARATGAHATLVRTGNGATTEASLPSEWQVPVYDDLSAAAAAIVRNATSK
jgi:D-glycero-D-manno-heptose 1,7-bisphosphate phosphatase